MTGSQRRRSLHLDLSESSAEDRPPLSALFLIKFDVKAGYTIAWKRAAPSLELSDSVEFKSLPSGLHNVPEDLVYFMHGDDYAGISAFVNNAGDKWERNALMLAVGALVPLEQGRLGRSWKHAPALKDIAKEMAQDLTKTDVLEKYWLNNQPSEIVDANGRSEDADGSADRKDSQSPASRKRKRRSRVKSISSAFGMSPSLLAPHHPALSLPRILHTFGPLVFPLYKAALLRKRILLVNEAPVELACNFVYDVSILSNIPSSVWEQIPLEPLPARLQPLFSIGVHDIDDLAQRSSTDGKDAALADGGFGWVACTTDNVLSTKTSLYDVIVTLPNDAVDLTAPRTWPSIKASNGLEVRASQRDFRRYRTLRQCQKRSAGLAALNSPYTSASGANSETNVAAADDETTQLLPRESQELGGGDGPEDPSMGEKLVEPLSWSALAYNSFIWWASAGEQRTDLEEEAERDAAMFRDYNSYVDTPSGSRTRRHSSPRPPTPNALAADAAATQEMAIIGYFHRLTALILGVLATVVDAHDASNEDQAEDAARDEKTSVYVSGEDMGRMGLDMWSDSDRHFVEELVELYWGRSATVQGGRIECCGVRIL